MGPLDGKPHPECVASLTRLYENYNRQYFAGQLPRVTIQVSEKNDSDFLQAEYDQASGTIYFYLSDWNGDCTLRTTLLHEMVHIAVPEDGHGARFRAELQRLADAGDEGAEYEVWRMVGDHSPSDVCATPATNGPRRVPQVALTTSRGGRRVRHIKPKRRCSYMGKIIDCHKVNPTSDCQHVVRGASEEEVLQKAGEHAREHGLAPTPELLAQVKSFIEDE